MAAHGWNDQFFVQRTYAGDRPRVIQAEQATVAHDVGINGGQQTPIAPCTPLTRD